MNKPLAFATLAEAATGVALIVVPSVVARLLLGSELSGVADAVGRVAGVSLLALGLACWPGKETTRAAMCGMATYGLLVTVYLLYLGMRGEWVGPLLWPAVVLHAVLMLLLARSWFGAVVTVPNRSWQQLPAAGGRGWRHGQPRCLSQPSATGRLDWHRNDFAHDIVGAQYRLLWGCRLQQRNDEELLLSDTHDHCRCPPLTLICRVRTAMSMGRMLAR